MIRIILTALLLSACEASPPPPPELSIMDPRNIEDIDLCKTTKHHLNWMVVRDQNLNLCWIIRRAMSNSAYAIPLDCSVLSKCKI